MVGISSTTLIIGLSICKYSWDSVWNLHKTVILQNGDLLRRTATFDPVCFLYTSFLCISKAKTVKGTLLQTDNFFQSSDKNTACLMRTQIKKLGISEKQRIKLDILSIFSKINIFLDFKTTIISFDFILQFWRSAILSSRTLYLFFQVALGYQPTVVLRHWKRYWTGTFKPYSNCSINYWFL